MCVGHCVVYLVKVCICYMCTVDVRAYNAILSIANFVKDSNEDRWNYIIVSLLAAV